MMPDDGLGLSDYGPNRSAPHAVEAEEALLGCVLINPDSFMETVHLVRAQDFFLHKNRWIWDAYVNLHEAGLGIDIITVTDELERRNQLEETGGAAYLTQLINAVPTSLHAGSYAVLVAKEAIRRAMIDSATAIAQLAYDEKKEVSELLAEMQEQVNRVARHVPRPAQHLRDLVGPFYDHLVELYETPVEQTYLTSTLKDLDNLVGGLFKGDLDIFAGRPGSGKSTLMHQIAVVNGAPWQQYAPTLTKLPRHFAVFTLEMSVAEVIARMMASLGAVEVIKFRKPHDMTQANWDNLRGLVTPMGTIEVMIDYTPGLTPRQLPNKCLAIQGDWGLEGVVVDYLQIMHGNHDYRGNKPTEISDIAAACKEMAGELNIWVGGGAQMSRAQDTRAEKRPVMSDLGDSSGLEKNSNDVHFLYPDPAQANVGTIITAKARNAATGDTPYVFDKPFSAMRNAEVRHIDLSNL